MSDMEASGATSIRNQDLTISHLPFETFVQILQELEAWEVINCQRVCAAWYTAFSQQTVMEEVLRRYPRSRGVAEIACTRLSTNSEYPGTSAAGEDRNCASLHPLDTPAADPSLRKTSPELSGDLVSTHGTGRSPNVTKTSVQHVSTVFSQVASRYYHMSCGKARQIHKYALQTIDQIGRWYPVAPWDYHESQPGGRLYYENAACHLNALGNKPYLFRPTLWSYDDGLVACALLQGRDRASLVDNDRSCLSILDLRTGRGFPVPFDVTDKVIRNIKLCNQVLVVEWAQSEPYHRYNYMYMEKIHRHLASCFDVNRTKIDEEWSITFRSEWQMHFAGIPLNSRDRFLSTHDGKHYVAYFWQPNRSMYTGDEDMPVERLAVWDISVDSPYRPLVDNDGEVISPDKQGPHRIKSFSFHDLDFLGLRQFSDISLLSIDVHSDAGTLTFYENICEAGQGYFDPANRMLLRSQTTTFAFRGPGAARYQEYNVDLPPYRGHCSNESSNIEELGQWYVPIMDVYDAVADVRFSLVETCFTGAMGNQIVLRIRSRGTWQDLDSSLAREIGAMGRIAGDERWIVGQNAKMELVVLGF